MTIGRPGGVSPYIIAESTHSILETGVVGTGFAVEFVHSVSHAIRPRLLVLLDVPADFLDVILAPLDSPL